MRTYLDCLPCLVRQALESARLVTDDPAIHERLVRDLLKTAADLDLAVSPPHISQLVHRRLRELTGGADPYAAAKRRFNGMASRALPDLAMAVCNAGDPLRLAARYAVVANAIDMGVGSRLTEEDVRRALRGTDGEVIFGDWEAFRSAAAAARSILYLADNAGEIAIDRLVVEQLGPGRVTVVVRGAPVLNDATMEDAEEVGLTSIVRVIGNGSDAPGTILDDCSAELRREFEEADLVIAKGQGNYETLSGVRSGIAFWFKVKCETVSRHAGLPLNAHALLPPSG